MTDKLPIALEREPLVEAVFEVRMSDCPPLADILPGALLASFDNHPILMRLPAAEIPMPLRSADPNLMYAPILRLELERYLISVGDRNVVVSCKLPYPKWPSFKAQILDVMQRVLAVRLSGNVVRYSVKYVNIIPAIGIREQLTKVRMQIELGGVSVSSDDMQLRVHRIEADTLHIISVVSGAEATLFDASTVSGIIVDIDSIRDVTPLPLAEFASGLDDKLEGLRHSNKSKFFSCLTEEAISAMGPVYA